jgi:hypothetical protein
MNDHPALADRLITLPAICLLEIDFGRPKKDIMAEISAWVDSRKVVLSASGRKIEHETRGRHSPKDVLHKLAAFRVLRATGLTGEEACTFFPEIYKNPQEWSEAKKAVEQHLKYRFP